MGLLIKRIYSNWEFSSELANPISTDTDTSIL